MNLDALCAVWAPRLLSVLRVVVALLFMTHGIAKHFKYPAIPAFAKLEPVSLIGFAGGLELVGGALLILGLFTRPVAFILSGEMAFAYFLGHVLKTGEPVLHPLNNGGSLAIALCFACLFISTAGGGPYSVDAMMSKKD
jgi:putative oxidoreductase